MYLFKIILVKDRELQVRDSATAVNIQNEIDYINLTDMTSTFREGRGLIGKCMPN